jgi:hypothetical protein
MSEDKISQLGKDLRAIREEIIAAGEADPPAPAPAPGQELDLAEIEARLKAATPGPWHFNRDYEVIEGVMNDGPHWELDTPSMEHIGFIAIPNAPYPADEYNIELIANAPTDIAALIKEVKYQREYISFIKQKYMQLITNVTKKMGITGLIDDEEE